jgi:hypothetical protein
LASKAAPLPKNRFNFTPIADNRAKVRILFDSFAPNGMRGSILAAWRWAG